MIKDQIRAFFAGEISDEEAILKKYSRDASLMEVKPELVLYPKNTDDLKKLVTFVTENKVNNPTLSITGRSAGTDMSGGPLNDSLILDFTPHFKFESVDLDNMTAVVEPGVFYRDFETISLPSHISLPVYPASKQLAALGGMVMNNAAGEKTLRYGQIREFVEEVSMVLSDGNEYTFGKLTRPELEVKLSKQDFEGDIYRKVYKLIQENKDVIKAATPTTSKNSAGYALWRVWDAEKDIFDLSQLFVGSQGTLGLLTRTKVRLVKDMPHRKLVALFFKSWNDLPAVVNEVLPYKPESMEAFDDETLKLGLRFMPEIAKKAGESFIKFAMRFLPETLIGMRMMGIPKLIVLVEMAEESEEVLMEKIKKIETTLKKFPIYTRTLEDGPDSEKYWIMRRESFNLLRQHVSGKQTAPFIDDFAIDPAKMPEFLPKLLKILKDNGIKANIAGHAGNGNYHIIPLMDLRLESEREKIVSVAEKVYNLIIEFGGTITAEHNDGIIRTPFLKKMFGPEAYSLFVEVKNIFDPLNIFNPGKKVGGSIEYVRSHIAK